MKATRAVIEQRVSAVLKLRLDGVTFPELREYARAHEWIVSDGQLWRYVAKSDEELTAAVEKDRDKLLARHLAQRQMLFAKSVETGDFKGALACLKDEAELENLYPAAKHQHSGPDGGPIPHDHQHALTDADRDAIRQRLLARLGHRPGVSAGDSERNGH